MYTPPPDGRAGRKFGTIKHNSTMCSFDGCTNRAHARGLCTGHWNQWNKGRELTPLKRHNRVAEGVKLCPDCGEVLPVAEFHKKLGYQSSVCGACYNLTVRMKTYGLSRDDVIAMMHRGCDVCGDKPTQARFIHIDHCHTSGNVRGVLCHPCNTSLGLMNEDADRLRALADYIERHR